MKEKSLIITPDQLINADKLKEETILKSNSFDYLMAMLTDTSVKTCVYQQTILVLPPGQSPVMVHHSGRLKTLDLNDEQILTVFGGEHGKMYYSEPENPTSFDTNPPKPEDE
jgi:hypothetical protein